MSDDERHMHAALALGRTGLGRTWPNPSVACLLVKNGAIVGRGVTAPGGRPHAETTALAEAGEAARGATAYVTLEPCSHVGRTPPCADALIEAGVARVVAAMVDPDPRVAGNGMRRLAAAGIATTVGVLEASARIEHAGHVARVALGRPHVTLKIAVSSDGKIGRPGERVAITGATANLAVHALRARHDAIMVGARTVAIDDPLLSVRLPGYAGPNPVRVVLDTDLSLDPGSRLARDVGNGPVHVICGYGAPPGRAAALEALGIRVLRVSTNLYGSGLNLVVATRELVKLGLTRVLVEGGARLSAALLARDLVDDVVVLTAPRPIGPGGLAALAEGDLEMVLAGPRFAAVDRIARDADTERLFRRVR